MNLLPVRLHRSTKIVFTVALLLASFVVLSGEPKPIVTPYCHLSPYEETCNHGWPMAFYGTYLRMHSSFDKEVMFKFEQSNMTIELSPELSPWGLADPKALPLIPYKDFKPLPLAVDFLLATLLVAATVAAWEWRCRRYGPVRFGLRWVFAVVVLASLPLASLGNSVAERRREATVLESLKLSSIGIVTSSVTPGWAARLGFADCQVFQRVVRIDCRAPRVDLAAVSRLRHLHYLVIEGEVHVDGLRDPEVIVDHLLEMPVLQIVELLPQNQISLAAKERLDSQLAMRLQSAEAERKVLIPRN